MGNNASGADNPQGSLRDPSETKRIPLSEESIQLILGTLLGDAHIRKHGRHYRLELSHSPKQKEYLDWKYRLLKKDNLIESPPYLIMAGEDKKYPQWRCQTLCSPIFREFRREFYSRKKKRITQKILNQLTPFGLAVWYMDDGSVTVHKQKYSRELHLNSHNFNLAEHRLIQSYFKKVWNIAVKISKDKGKYRTALNATEGKKLLLLIKPHIINCMKYKVDLGYIRDSNAELHRGSLNEAEASFRPSSRYAGLGG